jgi:hypothetical protein
MNKHQTATYKTFGIDTSDISLSDNSVKQIFDQLSQGHLNWENKQLCDSLLAVRRDYPSRRYLTDFMKSVINPGGFSSLSPEYWSRRGFDKNNSIERAKFVQQSRSRVLQPEYWQSLGYTSDESLIKVKEEQSRRSKKGYASRDKKYRQLKSTRSIHYWLSRGYSYKEAEECLKQIAKQLSLSLKGRPCWIPLEKRNTNIMFYQALGLSKSEAKIALRKRQSTRLKTIDERNAYSKYYAECWWYTRQNLHLVANIEKRSSDYHLDHIFSIFEGFTWNVKPCIIGSSINLRIITAKENLQKQRNSSITLESLLYEYSHVANRNSGNI